MNDEQLSLQIEALLFALGRPLSRAELQKQLGAAPDAIERGLSLLHGRSGGIALVDDGKTLELRVSPNASELIERVRKEEYAREVGKAGLEALTAILYRGPLTRSEIDFVRGVNSSQTLRTLTMRGLVRKIPNPKDERSFLYEPTTELLSELGVTRVDDLPEYAAVREKLSALEAAYRASQDAQTQQDA